MRKQFSVALMAGLLCLVGMTKEAGATVTIALEWGECAGGCIGLGTDTLYGSDAPGQTLRLDIFLSHDLTLGLKIHVFSLNFDTALENELNLGPMAQAEWAGTDVAPGPLAQSYLPITNGLSGQVESSGATAGRINSYESYAIFGVLPANGVAYTVGSSTATAPARYRVGQAFFTANGAIADGPDIFSGFFNSLVDTIDDGNAQPVPVGTITFGTAALIPEPGTVSLLGLGLVGLVLASRRRRRS